jgi:hypothetical protein
MEKKTVFINLAIFLAYRKSRDFTRNLRRRLEEVIEGDQEGMFKDLTNYCVGFIEGIEATKDTADKVHKVFIGIDDILTSDPEEYIKMQVLDIIHELEEQEGE